MAVLVLLHFHKAQRLDGSMDVGHFGFRLVKQKVLQLAPCSVGVVVDRDLGKHATRREAPGVRPTTQRMVRNAPAPARAKARASLFETKKRAADELVIPVDAEASKAKREDRYMHACVS
ncbi:cation/H(+) antiporter 28 [Panicum miliaceum]|uniref:Cation/H(+) antiporter 28 n=1 Tax=Panicum miliaceum TaxID=4540 RepID=A0A3L6TDE0_PANMI|nr:cation/H(+) antiporter 28 [Panicum miliaceum]